MDPFYIIKVQPLFHSTFNAFIIIIIVYLYDFDFVLISAARARVLIISTSTSLAMDGNEGTEGADLSGKAERSEGTDGKEFQGGLDSSGPGLDGPPISIQYAIFKI